MCFFFIIIYGECEEQQEEHFPLFPVAICLCCKNKQTKHFIQTKTHTNNKHFIQTNDKHFIQTNNIKHAPPQKNTR